jgi:hypothetical protein
MSTDACRWRSLRFANSAVSTQNDGLGLCKNGFGMTQEPAE